MATTATSSRTVLHGPAASAATPRPLWKHSGKRGVCVRSMVRLLFQLVPAMSMSIRIHHVSVVALIGAHHDILISAHHVGVVPISAHHFEVKL